MTNLEATSNPELDLTANTAENIVEATPVDAIIPEKVEAEETTKSNSADIEALKQQKLEQKKNFLSKLLNFKDTNSIFEVEIIGVVKGGLRASLDGELLFLPAALYDTIRYTSEELEQFVGQKVNVKVEEVNAEPSFAGIPVVNRKGILELETLNKLNVGDIVSGKVTSIATFGVFVDLGGIEGLIHISRLSHHHVKDPKSVVKKGEEIKAKIIEINKDTKRIALSKKDLEESPWAEIESKFPIGTNIKGNVRRMTDFGAYVEIAPGIDALVRNNELSWTTRVNKASDFLAIGEEKEFVILTNSAEKNSISLSLRRLNPNPWEAIKEKYVAGFQTKAIVKNVHEKGALVTVGEEQIDAFLPKSKLMNSAVEVNAGAEIDVFIIEVVPDQESMIVRPEQLEKEVQSSEKEHKSDRPNRNNNRNNNRERENLGAFGTTGNESFTLGDLLSKASVDTLSTIK